MDDRVLQDLLTAVRESCTPEIWSKAVELCRAKAVYGESESNEEIKIRVASEGGVVNPTVVLWPEDQDWFCDCSKQGGGCVHAAAAVIALRAARKAGQKLPGEQKASARLRYLFLRSNPGLVFERHVILGDQSFRLETSLSSYAASAPTVHLSVSQADVSVELVTGVRASGVVPPLVLPRLLEALADCEDVVLDNKPVRPAAPCVPLQAVVEDCAEGYRVRVEQNPGIDEVFANAAVLCGDKLQAVGDCLLNAREIEEYRLGRSFARDQVADLLTELLPSLRERIPVRLATRSLPEVVADIAPRLLLETRRDRDALVVLPTIVYGDPPLARVDGDRLTHLTGAVPLRQRATEQRLAKQLEAAGLALGRRSVLNAQEGIALLQRIENQGLRHAQLLGEGHESFFLAPALTPKLRVQGQTFELAFESQDAGTVRRADPSAVLSAWRQNAPLVPLLEGGFAAVPADWLARFGPQIADLLAAREACRDGELPACALPDLARLCAALEQPPPPAFDKLRSLVQDFSGLAQAPLPPDLQATLRTYQRAGVNWLAFLRGAGLGAMLADDMGLGKTLQALCVLGQRSLVVVPTSVLHNWADEIEHFRPSLRYSLYYGPERSLDPNAAVVLTTYAILRLDVDQLAAQDWETVVLDEAQAIKNPESQVAQAAYRLRAQFRMTLTGTPVENRLEELWSQMHFLNRGLLGGRSDFQERYAKPIQEAAPGAASRLRDRLRPFLLRRLKSEVAPELPPRTEVVLRCLLSESERVLYDAIRATTAEAVVERLRQGSGVLAALEALLRLRQACCHSALVPGQQAESSSKIDMLLEHLDASLAGGHKALVFSQWTSLLDLTEPHLQRAGIAYLRLDGSTRDRESVVKSFQSEQGPPVLLISLKAGGTGLNLTAADHVYLLDPWWNPAVEDQAADRAHRLGQERPVLIHRLVAEGTVEESILRLQRRKRAVAEAALGEAEQAAGLTRDDLLELLGTPAALS